MNSSGDGGEGVPPHERQWLLQSLESLHHELGLALGLYKNGHHQEALRKASQRFINRIQELASRPDLDGSGLVEKAFSSQTPLLSFNNRETLIERDEHEGYRFLAAGLTRAIRNVVTHLDGCGLDALAAWEWLVFISAMHRRLDQAEQVAVSHEVRLEDGRD